MEPIQVPQTLDKTPLVLIFNASQIISFAGFTMVGFLIGQPFVLGAIGLVIGSYINKYQDKKPDGYLRHMLYYYGVPIMGGKHIPSGVDREFRP